MRLVRAAGAVRRVCLGPAAGSAAGQSVRRIGRGGGKAVYEIWDFYLVGIWDTFL